MADNACSFSVEGEQGAPAWTVDRLGVVFLLQGCLKPVSQILLREPVWPSGKAVGW